MARTSLREFLRVINQSGPSLFHFSSCSLCLPNSNRKPACNSSSCLLLSCETVRELVQVHACLITSGHSQDPFTISRILKCAAVLGQLSYALLVLQHLESPKTSSVNTLIKAFAIGPDPCAAVRLYFDIRGRGFLPNSYTYPPLSNACAKSGSSANGGKCHGQAIKNGVCEVVEVKNSLLHMYAVCGHMDHSLIVFDEICDKDVVSWNSMLNGFVKMADLKSANSLFDEMPEKNVVSWNVMIAGCIQNGNPGRGLKLFRDMAKGSLRGTITTMVSVVTACGRSNRQKEGRSVHAFFVRNFRDTNLIFATALVDMYSKCRRVNDARRLFDRISGKNLICWNAMILGHCIHESPYAGIALFEEMTGRGDSDEMYMKKSAAKAQAHLPDEVTFVGLLCACARARLLSEGQRYFSQMTSMYGLKPTFAHYWCMANLYFSCGVPKEVEQVLKKISGEPISVLCSRLLGACRFHGDVELGEHIAKQLIGLDPDKYYYYSLLCTIYAVAGRWESVTRVKMMMRERGMSGHSGSSLIDLNKIVQGFSIGDKSCSELETLYSVMDELASRLDELEESKEVG